MTTRMVDFLAHRWTHGTESQRRTVRDTLECLGPVQGGLVALKIERALNGQPAALEAFRQRVNPGV